MDLKKFAIRGIVILAICVALCLFFSGTVRTITTPKVRLAAAKRGKLEERQELSCKPAFPDVDAINFPLSDDMTLTIVRVNTRDGYTVSKGDVLIEAKVANYDSQRKTYQEAYDGAVEQLMTLDNKNRGVRVTRRDEAYADAFFALRDARQLYVSTELDMTSQLAREGLEAVEDGYPENASDALVEMIDDWRDARDKMASAQAEMDALKRYTVPDDVWSYITEKREQEQKRDEAEQNLRALVTLNDRAKAITAPHDGYVAQVNVKEGDTWDGSQELMTITAEGALPALRADISEMNRTVTEGMIAAYNPDSWDAIELKVTGTGIDSEGKKYADIELNESIIRARGSLYAMMQEETPMTLVFRAREATTLLPTGAVRGSGDERYVLVAEKNTEAFSGDTMKLRKMEVKVLGEYGGTTSVQEDLSYYTIAYGEDRAISEGDAVMEYLN